MSESASSSLVPMEILPPGQGTPTHNGYLLPGQEGDHTPNTEEEDASDEDL